jgi:hypothetical protein
MSDIVTRPSIPRLTGQTIIYSATGNDPAHDKLPLPDTERTVGQVGIDELRGIFAKFGIDSQTAGRAEIVSRYAELVGKIYSEAGALAVKQFLAERRRYGE